MTGDRAWTEGVRPVVLYPAQVEAFRKSGWVEAGPDGRLRFRDAAPMLAGKPIHVVRD